MDQNQIAAFAKKLQEVVRAIVFILRKSKRKILFDLNLALKRGKIAGKSLIGKISHHHHHSNNHADEVDSLKPMAGTFDYPEPKSSEYVEFSCSNTPAHGGDNRHHSSFLSHVLLPSLHLIKGRGGARYKAQYESIEEEMGKALECALNDAVSGSPVLPGFEFGRSSAPVRQLRVTDSPFPISNSSPGNSAVVDAAAEDFIQRFYSQLKRQTLTDS